MFKRLMVPIIVLVFAGFSRGEEPFAKMSFKEACAAAKRHKKVVLIDFYTTWCGPCKRMDKTTWKDKKVIAWMKEKTIALKVDAEADVELAKKYDIEGYPTIVFIKPDGTEIDRLVGGRDADGFLEDANAALSGKDGVARAKEKLKGKENDPSQRMQYGRSLEQKGKYDEALDEYLWCFDHGLEHNPAFSGVRLSFLLSNIHQLSAKLPRARDELLKRRDKAEAAINKGPSRNDDANPARSGAIMEFVAINRTFGDDQKTLELYDKLIKQGEIDGVVARLLLREVSGQLIKDKRYADLLKGVGDPKAYVVQAITQFEQIQAITKAQARDHAEEVASMMKRSLMEECTPVFESLVGTDQTRQANSISKKLIDFDGSADTYVTLIQRAVRAGNNEMARKLAASAEKRLEGEDAERVAHAAKDIPTE